MHSFSIGHNKYSDLTIEEFSKLLKGFDAITHAQNHDSSRFDLHGKHIPAPVDWRQSAMESVSNSGVSQQFKIKDSVAVATHFHHVLLLKGNTKRRLEL